MKRIAYLLVSFVLMLAACTAISTESAAPAVPAPLDNPPESEAPAILPVETAPTAVPESALNEQAAKPQFIMFTASW